MERQRKFRRVWDVFKIQSPNKYIFLHAGNIDIFRILIPKKLIWVFFTVFLIFKTGIPNKCNTSVYSLFSFLFLWKYKNLILSSETKSLCSLFDLILQYPFFFLFWVWNLISFFINFIIFIAYVFAWYVVLYLGLYHWVLSLYGDWIWQWIICGFNPFSLFHWSITISLNGFSLLLFFSKLYNIFMFLTSYYCQLFYFFILYINRLCLNFIKGVYLWKWMKENLSQCVL